MLSRCQPTAGVNIQSYALCLHAWRQLEHRLREVQSALSTTTMAVRELEAEKTQLLSDTEQVRVVWLVMVHGAISPFM